jgi:hypothetical protein
MKLPGGTTAYNGPANVTNTLSEYVDAGSLFPQVAYCGDPYRGDTTNSRLQRNLFQLLMGVQHFGHGRYGKRHWPRAS